MEDLKTIQPVGERSEEVQYIIERMPNRFGVMISLVVLFIFTLLMIFGWTIKYPDIVTGQIIINSAMSPVKLISSSSGKLHLNGLKSMQVVSEGQIIAYLDNATNPFLVERIDSILQNTNTDTEDVYNLGKVLPKNISIGELNIKYYTLINALQQLNNYNVGQLYQKQDKNLNDVLSEQTKAIDVAQKRVEMGKKSLVYNHKFYSRDSILFIKKVISESEFDKSQMNYFAANDSYQGALSNLINIKQAAQGTEGKLQELNVVQPDKLKELKIAVIAAYNDFIASKKEWEQKYIFRAPFKGKVQFSKFYTDNQFIQTSEPVFVIVPVHNKVYGQVNIPAQGSGKIKKGQEVIVKLDDFPYLEYGSITGRVSTISLTTISTKTESAEIDTYLIVVDFPRQLETNYGEKLDYKVESKGSAEIITKDRRLIERFFDNLKYILKQ